MPPKKGDLIKGQASLSGFFSGGRLVAAARPSEESASSAATSPQKSPDKGQGRSSSSSSGRSPTKGQRKRQAASSGPQTPGRPAVPQEVTELKEKIRVAGHKASPSASPANRRIYTGETDEEQEEVDEEQEGQVEEAKLEEEKDNLSSQQEKPSALIRGATRVSTRSSPWNMSSSKYFAGSSKSGGRKSDAIAISDSSEDEGPRAAGSKKNGKQSNGSASVAAKGKASPSAKRKTPPPSAVSKSPKRARGTPTSSSKASGKSAPRKGKAAKDEDDFDDSSSSDNEDAYMDDDDDEVKPSKSKVKNGKVSPQKTASKAKTEPKAADDMDVDEKEKPAEKPKFNWAAAAKRKEAGPAMPGSKEIPIGQPNCLAGITFVFTGELSSIGRDDAQNLAKRYGAKVTGAPSSKTSFVVLGENAGPSKLEKIKNFRLKTLDEDGFFDLIREKSKGPVKIDEATRKKMDEEQKKIEKAATEIGPTVGQNVYDNALWTSKYAPGNTKDLVGNAPAVAKLQNWLHDWHKSMKSGFKKPGKDASGVFRAVLLSGPPGIGKTSAAHVISKLEGFTPIELNASDVRSKKLIDASLQDTINNSSLDGWYNGGKINKSLSADGLNISDKTVLIMDEVDGMSGGDRGGVGAINALIRKTKVPIICICNDAKNPKMTPLLNTAFQIKFAKPDARQVKTRIMTIAFREKLKIPPEVVEQLIQAAQSDIRLVINMLSTWSLSKKTMNFDEGRELGAANAKPGMHTPFSLYATLSSPGLWAPTNRKTLNDKADLYFQDHAFMPLMVQQNYINQVPPKVARLQGKARDVTLIQEITKAASSISDGDIVDSMIHSSEQHWSLMPLHGVISTVKPMQYAHGGGGSFPTFTSWLGANSKTQRLMRASTELQARMRLVTTASRFEVRQQYLPYFFPKLVRPMLKPEKGGKGDAGVEDIIEFMDEYYLTTEDRDTILELGMGENDFEALGKSIPPATKAGFTRKYNAASHPVAFYKGTDIGAKAKKLVGDPAPDVEEAYEKEEEPAADDESDTGGKAGGDASDDEIDLAKDKFFKQKNAKGKGKSAAKKK